MNKAVNPDALAPQEGMAELGKMLAYFALGNLCRKRGELREAEQSFANALRLLQRHDPAEVLPDAEGITAGLLMQLIKGMNAGLNRR